jgi:tetratricopeptide (TPR) repeat protein
MTTPSKTLSPAELAKLEHAFAADPSSEAYRPLAEAYLAAGRFMEAMVVCKKGVKAHADKPEPRLLLVRVYADQGKDKKALEELAPALAQFPSDKNVLRTAARLQFKAGEADAGKANLLKAYEADPSDAETQAAMAELKVEAPKKAEPPPQEAPPTLTPVAAAPARTRTPAPAPAQATPARTTSGSAIPRTTSQGGTMRAVSAESPSPRRGSGEHPAQERAAPRRTGEHPAQAAPKPRTTNPEMRALRPSFEVDDEDEDAPARRKPAGKQQKAFFAMMGLIPLALIGYYVVGQIQAKHVVELRTHLTAASEALKHDSYDAYITVCKEAEEALKVDPNSTAAHAYLAYAYTIRWGEHGGGDEAQNLAREHLDAAKKTGEEDSHIYAADALLKTYGGQGAEALKSLSAKVAELEAAHKQSSLMYLTLGLIQMNAGDLEHARDSLQLAQEKAPGDPRVYAALGNLYRRRGQIVQAMQNFDIALRYEKNHPESLLGRSLVALDTDVPNYPVISEQLKKLLEADPPPSPRQLASAHLAKSLLVAKVAKLIPTLPADQQKALAQATGVPADKTAEQQLAQREEDDGFSLDRQNPELHLIKARRLMVDGQLDPAIGEVRKAISQDQTRAQFYVELAQDLMQKPGGEAEAQTALTTALKTMGDSPKLLLMLGEAYRKQNKLDDALAAFQRAVADPKAKNPDARLAIARIDRNRKDYKNALDQADLAAQEFLGQSDRVAEAYSLEAQIHEEQGNRGKADEFFQKSLNASSDYADGYYLYARFLQSDRKSRSKAHQFAQQYLKLAPHGAYASDAAHL